MIAGRLCGFALVGAWLVSTSATASGLPSGLSSPDRGVVCHHGSGVCFDRFGPSIGLTETFLGSAAAERLIRLVQARSAHGATGLFSLTPGVVCVVQHGPCRNNGEVHPGLSAAMYGPWPPRTRRAEVAAVVSADWKWVGTRYNNDSAARPRDAMRYLLRLEQNGSVHVRADCNEAWGEYQMKENRITIDIIRSTHATCGPASLDHVFLRDLPAASIFFLGRGSLFLDLRFDTGTMEFQR